MTKAGIPLTINAVIHRANIKRAAGMCDLAVELGARRVEVAHTQYYGWALENRAALMPSREDADAAWAEVEAAAGALEGKIVIDHVAPDYHARTPKPCVGGWGRRSINVSPTGKALPCHAAETIPGLEFWNVRDHSLGDIWRIRRRSTPFAARTGCASPAAPATGARSTSAAAAARRWRCRRRARDRPRLPFVAGSRDDGGDRAGGECGGGGCGVVYRRMERRGP